MRLNEPEPRPCKRFKHMVPTPTFIKHLEKREACSAVILYLIRATELELWTYHHRN